MLHWKLQTSKLYCWFTLFMIGAEQGLNQLLPVGALQISWSPSSKNSQANCPSSSGEFCSCLFLHIWRQTGGGHWSWQACCFCCCDSLPVMFGPIALSEGINTIFYAGVLFLLCAAQPAKAKSCALLFISDLLLSLWIMVSQLWSWENASNVYDMVVWHFVFFSLFWQVG